MHLVCIMFIVAYNLYLIINKMHHCHLSWRTLNKSMYISQIKGLKSVSELVSMGSKFVTAVTTCWVFLKPSRNLCYVSSAFYLSFRTLKMVKFTLGSLSEKLHCTLLYPLFLFKMMIISSWVIVQLLWEGGGTVIY